MAPGNDDDSSSSELSHDFLDKLSPNLRRKLIYAAAVERSNDPGLPKTINVGSPKATNVGSPKATNVSSPNTYSRNIDLCEHKLLTEERQKPKVGEPFAHCFEVDNNNERQIKLLQDKIDLASKNLNSDWSTKLVMDVYIYGCRYLDVDILEGCNKKENNGPLMYFDIIKYPSTNGFSGKGFDTLCRDLCSKSLDSGFKLIKNGKKIRKLFGYCQEFVCSRGVLYKKYSKCKDDPYRKTSFNNNRKNDRGKAGKSMSRQITTFRPIIAQCRCKFCFYVGCDAFGFFAVPGYGNNIHSSHAKLLSQEILFPTSLLPKDTKNVLKDLINTNASLGVAVNFVQQRTGHMISRQNVHWLGGISKNLSKIGNMENMDSSEKMVRYLKEKKYDHMILYHKTNDKKLYNDINLGCSNHGTNTVGYTHNITLAGFTHSLVLPTQEEHDCNKYVNGTRKSFEINEEQDVMLGLAWVNPFESDYLRLYPEVIFVDVIADTNKDNRHLFTATGKASNGKMFTFLRAFLPNQQGWVFRWIFSVVFPNMFHKQVLENVQVIISDGDPQEFTQIDACRKTVFPNAFRQRCGFHIVRMGWKSHIPGKSLFVQEQRVFYKNVCHHLKTWIYSWMKSCCETEDEYEVSKHMFFKFLNTVQIRNRLGTYFIDKVSDFVRKHVEVHDNNFCFFRRKHLRHFDEYVNSLHEGTNNAIRHSAAPIKANMCIENTLVVLNENSSRMNRKQILNTSKEMHGTKVYAKLECAKSLSHMGYSMLNEAWLRRHLYTSVQVAVNKWYVIPCKDVSNVSEVVGSPRGIPIESNNMGSPKDIAPIYNGAGLPKVNEKCKKDLYPRFKRVRVVTKVGNTLKCSCCYRDRYGIGCVHEYHIICHQFSGYNTPSHRECSIRWWNMYNNYGPSSMVRSKEEIDLSLLGIFFQLQKNDLKGLPIPDYCSQIGTTIDESIIAEEFKPATFPICYNYPNLTVLPKDLSSNTHKISGLTQSVSQSQKEVMNHLFDVDVDFSNIEDVLNDDVDMPKARSPYIELKPYFDDLTKYMEGYHTTSDMQHIKCFFQEQISYFQQLAYKDVVSKDSSMTKRRKNGLVSSTIPQSKKAKAHGTKHY